MSPMVKLPLALEHALLGFLRQRPMHAYEMYQQLLQAESLGLVWHLKQSHMYALLTRLEAEGYIAGITEPQGTRPPRKTMHLTPRGEAAFGQWVTSPVAHGRDFRLEFLAKLFFAGREGTEVVATLLSGQRQACQAWLADLHQQAGALEPERTYDWLVLQFRMGQIEAIVAWLDMCATALATTPA